MSFNYPAPRTTTKEVSTNYQMVESDRFVTATETGIIITLPPISNFPEGRIFTVYNATGGSFQVAAAGDDKIQLGPDLTSISDFSSINISRDYVRTENNWLTQ